MVKVVNAEELKHFLEGLKKKYNIVAPVKNKKGDRERIEYEYIDSFKQINIERQPDSSPKEFFLPQNKKVGNEFEGRPNLFQNKKTILFGVRSCDIEAIKITDDVFLDEYYVDEQYKRRRENTIIIGYSCSERQKSCFCDTLGIDPIENQNAPIYLFKIRDKFWFKVYDKKYDFLLEGLSDGDQKKLEEYIENQAISFQDRDFNLDLPVPLPEKTTFLAPFWENVAEKCIGCGICTYYCPTCYCFGFFWEESEKWKVWDSCMFSAYSRHASGHNPRENQHQRYRQRIMHKFSYHPENYEGLACVGCGRCIKECPVNLDIREALKEAEVYLKEKGGAD